MNSCGKYASMNTSNSNSTISYPLLYEGIFVFFRKICYNFFMKHWVLHIDDTDTLPLYPIGVDISIPMITNQAMEHTITEIHLQFKRIETLFMLGERVIPSWAREAFQEIQTYLKKHKTLKGYWWTPLLSILVWWFWEYDGKTFFESLGWKLNPKDIMIGRILFHLIRWSLFTKENRELIPKILDLSRENNTGFVIRELILKHGKERNLEYIGLIEDMIILASEMELESLILHEWKPYSILDLARICNDQEKRSDDESPHGDYTGIITILERRHTLTAEGILQKNSIELNIPLDKVPWVKFPFWIRGTEPIVSTINTHE